MKTGTKNNSKNDESANDKTKQNETIYQNHI